MRVSACFVFFVLLLHLIVLSQKTNAAARATRFLASTSSSFPVAGSAVAESENVGGFAGRPSAERKPKNGGREADVRFPTSFTPPMAQFSYRRALRRRLARSNGGPDNGHAPLVFVFCVLGVWLATYAGSNAYFKQVQKKNHDYLKRYRRYHRIDDEDAPPLPCPGSFHSNSHSPSPILKTTSSAVLFSVPEAPEAGCKYGRDEAAACAASSALFARYGSGGLGDAWPRTIRRRSSASEQTRPVANDRLVHNDEDIV